MSTETRPPPSETTAWRDSAWVDAIAFVVGLAVAWHWQWRTADLVWSLWLSSLVIGYAIIVWSILGPGIILVARACRDGLPWDRNSPSGTFLRAFTLASVGKGVLFGGAALVGAIFLLAFFTVHFGGFHFVHSVFLRLFFPIGPLTTTATPDPLFLWEVFQRYGWFLPAAALAERQAFRLEPEKEPPDDLSVTPEAIAARKARNARRSGMTGLMAPYRNVVRLHLLIFFFAAAHFARIENFLVYAVVYAVYFFPWRVLRRTPQD